MDSIFNYFTGDDTVDAAAKASGTSPGVIDSFKIKARRWASSVVSVSQSNVSGSPELVRDKAKLLRWAKYIKGTIEAIFGTIDELEGINLGIIPLIPIAAIIAALAAITKWTTDYMRFNQKLATYNKLKADGSSPGEASRIVDELLGDKPLFSIGNAPLIIGGIGAAMFFYFKK